MDATRFDRTRQAIGLAAGPLVFCALLVLPTGLDAAPRRMAAVFALVIVFWITEAIPLAATALLGPALAVVLGVAPAGEAFAAFGHPVLLLFIGSFLLARGMAAQGLDRRIALFFLSAGWVASRPRRVLLAFGGVAAFLSMWISNTATTAMMLPIALGVLSALPQEDAGRAKPFATALVLMVAFSSSVGGIATPVGSPPNLIAIGFLEKIAGRRLSFFEWMEFGLPVALVLFAVLFGVVCWRFAPGSRPIAGAREEIRRRRAALGPLGPGERAALAAFCVAITLWIVPGLVQAALGNDHPAGVALADALPESVVAILAASLLFLLPVDWRERRFALAWSEAARIDWGTILLFGGGLSLGQLAFSSGLVDVLGGGVLGGAAELPVWALALVGLFVANGMTELMSNTASANILLPLVLGLGAGGAGEPLPALAVAIGCSLAFCLPVATPPNAIAYGTGFVALPQMIRLGLLLDVTCGLAAWLVLLAFRG